VARLAGPGNRDVLPVKPPEDLAGGRLDLRQGLTQAGQPGSAHFGQHQAARGPVKQRSADEILERANMTRDRRLRQRQFLCRAGEILMPGRGLERPDVVQRRKVLHRYALQSVLADADKKNGVQPLISPRNGRTKAAARSTAASPGIRSTTCKAISTVMIPKGTIPVDASAPSGTQRVSASTTGSGPTNSGTNAGSADPKEISAVAK